MLPSSGQSTKNTANLRAHTNFLCKSDHGIFFFDNMKSKQTILESIKTDKQTKNQKNKASQN